jgi:hypothetical protein
MNNMSIMGSPQAIFTTFAGMGSVLSSAASAVWTYVSASVSRLFSCFPSTVREAASLEGREASVASPAGTPFATQQRASVDILAARQFNGGPGGQSLMGSEFAVSDSSGHAGPSGADEPLQVHARTLPKPNASTPPTTARTPDRKSKGPDSDGPKHSPDRLDGKHAPASSAQTLSPRFDDVMRDKPWVPATREQALEYAEKWIASQSVENLSKIKLMRGNAAGEVSVPRFIGSQAAAFLDGMVDAMLAPLVSSASDRTVSVMDFEAAAGRAFTDALRDIGPGLPASEKGLLREVAGLVRTKDVQDLAGLSPEQRVIANLLVLKALGKVLNDRMESSPDQTTKNACKVLMRVSTTICESGEFRTGARRPFDEIEGLAFDGQLGRLKAAIAAMSLEAFQVTDHLLDF